MSNKPIGAGVEGTELMAEYIEDLQAEIARLREGIAQAIPKIGDAPMSAIAHLEEAMEAGR